jgi:hypothetical protein
VELYVNPEIAWGNAPGGGNGLAGYLNGDLIGQPVLNSAPYLARAFVRIRIPMRQEHDEPVGREDVGRAPNLIAGPVPQHRLVVTVGRFAATDVFDFNSYANNARTQFINNSFVNGLSYDYPQDVRGYDYGAAVAFVNPAYAIRFGTFATPTSPGSATVAYNPSNSHSEQLELQAQPQLLRGPKPASVVRLLLIRNVANAGRYSDALNESSSPPDLSMVRHAGTVRNGAELNFEQGLADGGATGIFARAGVSDGSVETDAYAEADSAISIGGQLAGTRWKRKNDVVGLAFGASGIGKDHQLYLSRGGSGSTLGDGALRYGPEHVLEGFYLYQACKSIQLTLDAQFLGNPGYNQDRGPATALSFRVRYSF